MLRQVNRGQFQPYKHTGSFHLGHASNILLAKANHVAKSPQIKEAGNYTPLAVGGRNWGVAGQRARMQGRGRGW